MAAVANVIGNDVLAPIVAYAGEKLTNPNWNIRYSALLALGAIVEASEKQYFCTTLAPGLDNLLAMFSDKSMKVRKGIAWVFSRIS